MSAAGSGANSTKPIHSHTPIEEDQWTVSKNASTETHTFYLFTPDKTFIFFQLAYAKVSFITNIQVTFSFITDDKHAFITSTCSSSSFKNTNNNLNARSDTIEIERSGKNFVIKLLPKSGADGTVQFEPSGSGLKVGTEQENIRHSFYLPCKVSGDLKIAKLGSSPFNCSGDGFFNHATLTTNPYSIFSVSHFLLFQSDRVKIMNLSYKPLNGNKEQMIVQAFVFVDGELKLASAIGNVNFESSHNDSEVDLVVPDSIKFTFEGPTLASDSPSGEISKAVVTSSGFKVIERFDVLQSLPYMLRKIVQAFITKPYIYQFYRPAQLSISFSESEASDPLTVDGVIYYELSYL